MKYSFVAKDAKGRSKTGIVEASDSQSALKLLQDKSLVVVSIERADRNKTFEELSYLWEGVSTVDLVMMFLQLVTLIGAKVPILTSFRVIQKQITNKHLLRVLQEVGDDIEDGTSLYESMSRHPRVFTPLMVSMVRSGEVSGHLHESLEYIASNLEKNYALTSKIKGALMYPGFILSAALIVGFLVITFILPNLTQIIKDMGVVTPWYTQLLMNIGDFMKSYWWLVIAIFSAVVGFVFYYIHTPVGKREWDKMQLKVPVIGQLLSYMYISRFSDNFSTLLSGGIPVVTSLQIVASVVGNSEFERVLLEASDEAKKGGNISSVFRRSEIFPPIVTQMLEIGEETGETEETLKSVTSFYDQQTDSLARNLTTLIEPFLIVVLGIGVAIMVVGILLPIYNISSTAISGT
ncbi:MAG: type II secretion system F family protein [Candidatus Moranbacteria bacterium]|nr:type II secretion system F family protein [Candidatus Moranbacteria bacterium]